MGLPPASTRPMRSRRWTHTGTVALLPILRSL